MAIQRDADGKIVVRRKPLHDSTPSTTPVEVSEPVETVEEGGSEGRKGVAVRGPETPARVDSRGPLADYMCGAKLRGDRAGELCRTAKMNGAKRCRMHGSASRMAREAAHERILKASDYAAKKLIEFLTDPDAPYNIKLAAARDLLDRADLSGTSKVEVGTPHFMETFARSVKMVRPGGGSDDETDDPWSAVESGRVRDVVDAEIVRDEVSPATPEPTRAAEPRVDVNPPLPSYLQSRMPPRTTEMRR